MPKDTKGSNENSTDEYVVIPEEMKKFDKKLIQTEHWDISNRE